MDMKEASLYRLRTGDQGTLGLLVTPGFICRTIELPWRGNGPNISCIPTGVYEVTMRKSPRLGWVYWVQNVEGRSWILTHYGNLAGDVSKKWKTHSEGCIIVGKYHGKLNGQDAVLLSRMTLNKFIEHMNREDFKLTIKNV